MANLEKGKQVDLDGYCLSPALYANLCGLDLIKIDLRKQRCLVLNVSHRETLAPPFAQLREEWQRGEGLESPVSFDVVKLQPFWNLIGYIDCSPLIEKTREWLTTIPITHDTPNHPRGNPGTGLGD